MCLLLAHVLVLTAAAAAADNDDKDDAVLTLHHVASTMTSITVSWSDNSTKNDTHPVYQIEALNLATKVQLISPPLSVNESEYTLPDLAVDAEYQLCVISTGTTSSACAVLSTIPVVRDDSLIALFIALAVLGAVILIAFLLWRCAIRRATPADDTEVPSDDKPDEDEDKHGVNEKAPLLVTTPPDTDQASPAPTDPDNPQTDPSKQEQPQSLYLFLAGHAFK